MAYSQPNDIRQVLAPGVWPVPAGQPAPRTNTAADLNDAQLAHEIEQADQLIDSYIGTRYATPVAEVDSTLPIPLHTWSTNIAAYLATLTFRKGKDISPQDPVSLRYAMTVQQLIAVRDGKSTLNAPPNTGISGGQAGAPVNPYQGTLFGTDDFDLMPAGPAGDWRRHWMPLL